VYHKLRRTKQVAVVFFGARDAFENHHNGTALRTHIDRLEDALRTKTRPFILP
jgi:hypothetical protein